MREMLSYAINRENLCWHYRWSPSGSHASLHGVYFTCDESLHRFTSPLEMWSHPSFPVPEPSFSPASSLSAHSFGFPNVLGWLRWCCLGGLHAVVNSEQKSLAVIISHAACRRNSASTPTQSPFVWCREPTDRVTPEESSQTAWEKP